MAKKILCPQCRTRNVVPVGAAGIHCTACGSYIQLGEEESPPPPEGFLERLVDRFSSPRGIIIGSICLLLFFVAFWSALQIPSSAWWKQSGARSQRAADQSADADGSTDSHAVPSPGPPVPITPAPATDPNVALTAPTTAPATQSRPTPHPLPPLVVSPNDQQIGQAIRDGAHFLMSQYDPVKHTVKAEPSIAPGANALCVYALLQCNEAIADPDLSPASDFMQPVLKALKEAPLDIEHETYNRSLRANALALIDRAADRPTLQADVAWLLAASRGGAYAYKMPAASVTAESLYWDNSNSQYGLLGVWAGTEVGMTIPRTYWQAVQDHWTACQLSDGGFGYPQGGAPRLSMTAAAIASLTIAHDYLAQSAPIGVDSRSPALIKALAWMDQDDNAVRITEAVNYFTTYTLYGVARAGLASNYKYFGKHDWYTELARTVLPNQQKDGSFGDTIDTAFTLLFLARGRHPIIFNKLSMDGMVVNHPRDTANLARYASHQLEHTFNAQIVPLSVKWTEWMDSPVLYMAAALSPPVSDDEADQLFRFVQAGGLLLTHADGNSAVFNGFAAKLAQRLFPDYPYKELAPDNPIYTALFKLNPPPKLMGVSNGARLLMVNSPRDVAKSWDVHDWKTVEPAYQLGLNIFLYAAGERDFRNRLDTSFVPVPQPDVPPEVTLKVARLRYAGSWDPEPYAWTRFSRKFQWATAFAANVGQVDVKDLDAQHVQIADLTGIDAHQFSAAEHDAMRRFVQAGGVLLIDSCGGSQGFASSQTGLLAALFPGAPPVPIAETHPLVNGTGPCMDRLSRPLSRIPGPLLDAPGIVSFGAGHVIITPLDLTEGLLGNRTLGIRGYHPDYAWRFVKNLLLWDYNGQPEQ
jgi:hypothetical protein